MGVQASSAGTWPTRPGRPQRGQPALVVADLGQHRRRCARRSAAPAGGRSAAPGRSGPAAAPACRCRRGGARPRAVVSTSSSRDATSPAGTSCSRKKASHSAVVRLASIRPTWSYRKPELAMRWRPVAYRSSPSRSSRSGGREDTVVVLLGVRQHHHPAVARRPGPAVGGQDPRVAGRSDRGLRDGRGAVLDEGEGRDRLLHRHLDVLALAGARPGGTSAAVTE